TGMPLAHTQIPRQERRTVCSLSTTMTLSSGVGGFSSHKHQACRLPRHPYRHFSTLRVAKVGRCPYSLHSTNGPFHCVRAVQSQVRSTVDDDWLPATI